MGAAPTFVDALGQNIAVPDQGAGKGAPKGKRSKGGKGKAGKGERPQGKNPESATPADPGADDPPPETVTAPLTKAKQLAKSVSLGLYIVVFVGLVFPLNQSFVDKSLNFGLYGFLMFPQNIQCLFQG